MAILNISIDDVSPHINSSTTILDQCHNLTRKYPNIKFSLFIPMAYWRTLKNGQSTTEPLFLYKYKDTCDILRSLNSSNFELCYHGVYHGIPGLDNNNEFRDLSQKEADDKFEFMSNIAQRCGLSFKNIFKPPAWKMSPFAIKSAKERNILLELCKSEQTLINYDREDTNVKVVYSTNCTPQLGISLEPIMTLTYHACNWDPSFFTPLVDNLDRFINKNHHNIEFMFLEKVQKCL